MGPVGGGFAEALIVILVICCLIVGGIVYTVTRLTEKKEFVFSKPLVPQKRLVTDGMKVDTVYVYKIK